jgi:chemotaxis protein methyltransferase CheR
MDACNNFDCTLSEYIEMLKNSNHESPIFEQLIVKITIGETYFFRDKKQMELLQLNVLPKIIAEKRKKNNLSLRIWSAGCSTGEEIYTLAMILDKLLIDKDAWIINLLGTDINTKALVKALEGKYSEWSMRSIPESVKNDYFIQEGSHYLLSEKILKMVKFDYVNLNDNVYPSILNGTNSQDLIVCRNVLIYFDSTIVKELMQRFYSSLQIDGYLLLGASDPTDLESIKSGFQYIDNMLFIRSENKVIHSQKSTTQYPVNNNPPKLPRSGDISNKKKLISIDQNKIQALLDNAQWQTILSMIGQIELEVAENSFYLFAKATALANLGNLEYAAQLFERSLRLDPTNKYSHFIYALTLLELNKFVEAEKELRKSIYLDRNFVIGYYQLGLLMLRHKQISSGLKCLENALLIASKKNVNDSVNGSVKLSYGQLSDILKREILIYSNYKDNINA